MAKSTFNSLNSEFSPTAPNKLSIKAKVLGQSAQRFFYPSIREFSSVTFGFVRLLSTVLADVASQEEITVGKGYLKVERAALNRAIKPTALRITPSQASDPGPSPRLLVVPHHDLKS